jgi:hypothetical protein
MSYLIRPIKFEKEVPSIDTISEFVKKNSSQEIVFSTEEFKNQYSAILVKYPEDVLYFKINENEIVISGDAYNAPALCEILYTTLRLLGGNSPSNIPLLEFPISDIEIRNINSKVRKDISALGLIFWFFVIVTIVLIFGVIYFLFSLL